MTGNVPWPWQEENGPLPAGEGSNTYDETTITVFTILRDWFYAMESHTAEQRHPDPSYVRRNGKPLTEQQVNNVIEVALDQHFSSSPNRNYAIINRGIPHDLPPDFNRLAFPQRLALVQQLCSVLDEPPHEEGDGSPEVTPILC